MKIKILKNKKNKIKLPKKRIEFERFLLKMGIRDRNAIMSPITVKTRIFGDLYPDLKIYRSIKGYLNKKSYVYEYYKSHTKEKTLKLYNKLNISNTGRIGEIMWSIILNNNIELMLNKEKRKEVLFTFIKESRKILSVGMCGEILKEVNNIPTNTLVTIFSMLGVEAFCFYPKPYDILVSKPSGSSFEGSIFPQLGRFFPNQVMKKSIISKRMGFGNLDEDLHQYAFYDENLRLIPIEPT
jgi:hypothetical protein